MDKISEFIEYKVAMVLWKSYPPIFLVLGTFGNVLTIIILMQRTSRQSSTSVYLTALATSDLLVLWTGLFRQWIKYTFETDLIDESIIWCKSQIFLVYTSFQCSSWFLVAVTSERFIGVWFPHKAKLICTPRKSVTIIMTLTAFFIVSNIHWFYGFNIISYPINTEAEEKACDNIDNDNYEGFLRIFDWIDLCLVSLIPLTLLSVANGSIIFYIIKRKKRIQNRTAPLSGTTSNSGRNVSQMTVTLVAVNVVFIVCTTPITIHTIEVPFLNEDETPQKQATNELWWAVANLLAYLNTILNFILYFLSVSKFRQQAKNFFTRNRSTLSSDTGSVRPPIHSNR